MDWFDARVQSRRQVAGTVHVEVDARPEVRASFVAPGQYLMVKLGALLGPFAPATAPGAEGPLELLFKPGTPLTDALEALPLGGSVELSLATGAGFPMQAAKGHALLLVAVGTGQAPMRSVIDCVRAHRQSYGAVTLLLGVKDSDHLAFAGQHEAWERDGIDVHVTLSQAEDGWRGRTGRVQLHLPTTDLSSTVAFVVGHKQMVDEVVTQLQRRGLPRAQIFLNV